MTEIAAPDELCFLPYPELLDTYRALRAALEGLPGNATLVDKRVEYSMIESGKLRATATLEAVMQIGREAEAAAP